LAVWSLVASGVLYHPEECADASQQVCVLLDVVGCKNAFCSSRIETVVGRLRVHWVPFGPGLEVLFAHPY